jgi:hypothetical protein
MRITREFKKYNERRYTQPWIAKITAWPVGKNPTLDFGGFIGNPEEGGEVEINANVGDIVRWGQKDSRGNNTVSLYGIVQSDGTVKELSATEARKAWAERSCNANPSIDLSSVSNEDLLAEVKKRGLM